MPDQEEVSTVAMPMSDVRSVAPCFRPLSWLLFLAVGEGQGTGNMPDPLARQQQEAGLHADE